jgi:hypothetical protein
MATLDLNRDAVLDMIGAGRGPQDGVWIPLVFVEWLGSYTTAAMMNQILYYRDIKRRKGEDEFYMSYPQWRESLHLTEREVRNGLDRVRQVGVITKARRAPNGDRVLYYRVDAAVFIAALQAFLSGRSVQNVRTEVDAMDGPDTDETYERSNTKTSPKTSAKRESAPAPVTGDIPRIEPSGANRDMATIPPGMIVTARPDAPKLRAVPKFAQTPEFAATLDTLIEIWPRRKDGAGPNRKLAERALVLVAPSEYPAVLAGARRVAASPDSREGVIKNLHAWLADEDCTRYTVGARPAGGAVYANGKRA